MRFLLIDDMRNLETVVDMYTNFEHDEYRGTVARTYQDGIDALRNNPPFDFLFLDHDLASYDGEGREKTGYDVVCFLEANSGLVPTKDIICVSSNPVGKQRIKMVVDKLYGRI
jgi:hypothetical protein